MAAKTVAKRNAPPAPARAPRSRAKAQAEPASLTPAELRRWVAKVGGRFATADEIRAADWG